MPGTDATWRLRMRWRASRGEHYRLSRDVLALSGRAVQLAPRQSKNCGTAGRYRADGGKKGEVAAIVQCWWGFASSCGERQDREASEPSTPCAASKATGRTSATRWSRRSDIDSSEHGQQEVLHWVGSPARPASSRNARQGPRQLVVRRTPPASDDRARDGQWAADARRRRPRPVVSCGAQMGVVGAGRGSPRLPQGRLLTCPRTTELHDCQGESGLGRPASRVRRSPRSSCQRPRSFRVSPHAVHQSRARQCLARGDGGGFGYHTWLLAKPRRNAGSLFGDVCGWLGLCLYERRHFRFKVRKASSCLRLSIPLLLTAHVVAQRVAIDITASNVATRRRSTRSGSVLLERGVLQAMCSRRRGSTGASVFILAPPQTVLKRGAPYPLATAVLLPRLPSWATTRRTRSRDSARCRNAGEQSLARAGGHLEQNAGPTDIRERFLYGWPARSCWCSAHAACDRLSSAGAASSAPIPTDARARARVSACWSRAGASISRTPASAADAGCSTAGYASSAIAAPCRRCRCANQRCSSAWDSARTRGAPRVPVAAAYGCRRRAALPLQRR